MLTSGNCRFTGGAATALTPGNLVLLGILDSGLEVEPSYAVCYVYIIHPLIWTLSFKDKVKNPNKRGLVPMLNNLGMDSNI